MKRTKQHHKHVNKQNVDYDQEHEHEEQEIVPHQARMRKSIWMTSLILIGIAIVGSFFTTSFSDEGTADEVVANRMSTSTVAGEDLFTDETNANIEARNFEVMNAGSDGGEARMLIWDFNKV